LPLLNIPCRVCDRDSADFLFKKSGWNIVRCRNCGFIYVNPIPDRYDLYKYYSSGIKINWRKENGHKLIENFQPEKVKTDFDQMRPSKGPRGRIWVRKQRLVRWNRYLPQEGRFLDVGCAEGYLVMAAKKIGKWSCFGIDIQMNRLRYAHSYDPILPLCIGADDQLCFKDETFDIITMTHLLEHTFDPLNTLMELSRILRRKGVLVVTVPNVAHPLARLRGEQWRRINPPVHLWYFSPQTLTKLMEKTGLKVIHKEISLLRCNLTVFAKKD